MRYLLSFLLSFTIVFSQMGIVQQTHYCGGKPVLKELLYSNKTLGCTPTENTSKEVCSNINHNLSKEPCCRNANLELSITDKFQKKNEFTFNVFISSVIEFRYFISSHNIDYSSFIISTLNTYIKDIPIWHQSFLI